MKAGVLESIERLVVKDWPEPALENGSVIIEVKVCSICNSDLRIYHYGHPRTKLPQVLGHEISGVVRQVSRGVASFKEGDRVAVTPRISCGECAYCRRGQYIYCKNSQSFGYQLPGGLEQYMLVPARGLQFGVLNKFPDTLSFEQAAMGEPLACCIRAQNISRVGAGDTVAVIGAGPMGILHCRLARARGAAWIVLAERRVKRIQGVDLSAADRLVDSTTTDPREVISQLTEGRGADVVIVACSSQEAQEQSSSWTANGGRVNFFGGLAWGLTNITVDSNAIHYREVSLQGSHGSLPSDNRVALDLIAQKKVIVGDLISHTFPLDAIEEAFRLAESKEGIHVAVRP